MQRDLDKNVKKAPPILKLTYNNVCVVKFYTISGMSKNSGINVLAFESNNSNAPELG